MIFSIVVAVTAFSAFPFMVAFAGAKSKSFKEEARIRLWVAEHRRQEMYSTVR